MKRNITTIFFVLLVIKSLTGCTKADLEVYKPIDVSKYDASASYFNYGGYTHFILSYTKGTTPISMELCSAELSTSDEKVVQPGSYTYSTAFGEGVLGKYSELNNEYISSGSAKISKDFLTYTIDATLNGTSYSYTGYILSVTSATSAFKVTGCKTGSSALALTNANNDTLYITYSGDYVGTIAAGSGSYYADASGNRTEIKEGTLTITEADKVYTVAGSLLTETPSAITVSGKWSNEVIINGTVSYSVTDQSSYNNTWCVATFTDNSGFVLNTVVVADLGQTFYSASGLSFSVAGTFANNTIVNGYDWGAYGSGGTSITVSGTKHLITSGSLKFTSSDGITITVEGTVSDGTESFTIAGTYIKPTTFKYLATSDWTSYGGTYTLKFGTNNVSATYNSSTWNFDYAGTGEYLSLEFKQAIAAGTYTAKANDASDFNAASNFIIGYYNATYYSYSGAMYGALNSGTLTQETVTAGTVTVSNNSGTYTIQFELETESGEKVYGTYNGTLTTTK